MITIQEGALVVFKSESCSKMFMPIKALDSSLLSAILASCSSLMKVIL